MSGPMPHALARAAEAAAFAAEAAAFGMTTHQLGILKARAALRDVADSVADRTGVTAQQRAWAGISLRGRTLLVNLGARQPGDAQARARQPWASFSRDDQVSIASVREELLRDLAGADALSW